MKGRLIVLAVCLLVVLTPLMDVTAADSPRTFAPVQGGYVSAGEDVLPYAPDRIFVKFTDTAYKASRLKVNFVKGAEPADGLTGLASVDAISRDVGVLRISRPYHEPKNRIAAVQLGVDRWFRVDLASGADIEDIVARFAADPNVEYAKPDYRAFPAVTPNDPLYPDHWGHNNTAQLPDLDWGGTYDHTLPNTVGTPGFDANAPAAWDGSQGYGSSSVIVAILDSGVDIDHPDLNLVAGYDFGSNDSNPDDDSGAPGHGTCCAGVAAAIAGNGLGACGAAPGVSIMPCKCANNQGSMYFSYLDAALYWAADNGADIISMSLGAYANVGQLPATDAALTYAYNAGCLIVAATSNDNYSYISYPANHPVVMAIGAASPCGDRKRSSSSSLECNPGVSTDPNGYTCDGERWWGSCYGVNTRDAAGAVDILGPTILPTTDIGGSGGYRSGDYEPFFNGTSCATPYVAGVAALVKSKNPTWTNAQIRDELCNTAIDVVNVESGSGWDRYSGYGMVDAEAAVGGGGPVAPVAEFSGTPTSGIEPLTVDFTDMSSGSPTSWSWTFGDGGSSSQQNPSYTYNSAGTYTVTLTATNAVGSDGETKVGYITVDPCVAPTASFTGAPVTGYAPLTVDFTDASTAASGWDWTFGDGGTSTQQNPSYTYTAPGTYTVTLTVSNSCGSDGMTRTDYITVEEAVTQRVYASADIPVIGVVTGSYGNTFASDDSRETITEIEYTGHPVKRYSYAEHKWSFNVPANSSNVTFYVEGSRTDNSEGDDFIFAYSTDDATYYNLVTIASATEQLYSGSLPAGTSGTVYIRVLDADRSWGATVNDAVSVDEMYIEVMGGSGGVAPVAAFVGSPTSGNYPLEVTFVDQSANTPTSWDWDFGDGNGSVQQNPVHIYASVGTYTVTLTATNEYGSDVEVKSGYITVTDPGSTVYTHVEDIVVVETGSSNKLYGNATVTILDGGGAPVSGVTVYGVFNYPNTSSKSGVTGPDGKVTITSDRSKVQVDFCFEVTNVIKTGTTYDSGANLVTRSCESGDVFSAVEGFEQKTPEAFGLSQNYPNPFNPVTLINYSLPVESHVRLDVFNVKGERVATLIDRVVGAGYHSTEWNAAGMSSGIYFYRLQTPQFTETRKMILLR
ncbi:MAG TPA: PKD domain-containing protein [Candidatus Krumholzibacterium sp.]|nr:PKD domain-containing protein [Candidatus Krumholzibacterium sp.]